MWTQECQRHVNAVLSLCIGLRVAFVYVPLHIVVYTGVSVPSEYILLSYQSTCAVVSFGFLDTRMRRASR